MLNLRKLDSLKIVQDTGQILKNGFCGPEYRRAVFRQTVWEEHRSSISSLLQLGAGSAQQGFSCFPVSMGPRAEEVQVFLL